MSFPMGVRGGLTFEKSSLKAPKATLGATAGVGIRHGRLPPGVRVARLSLFLSRYAQLGRVLPQGVRLGCLRDSYRMDLACCH